MSEVSEEEFDLDAVIAKVRLDVAARRRAAASDGRRFSPPRRKSDRKSEWVSIGEHLDVAEGQARAVSMIPSMAHRHWLLRPLARLLSRLVFFLTKFQTIPQTRCNESMIEALLRVDSNGTSLSGRFSSLEYSLEAFLVGQENLKQELEATGDRLRRSILEMSDTLSSQVEELKAVANRAHEIEGILDRALSGWEVREAGQKLLEDAYLSFENLFRGT
ncbi:MAG TPA: hypothetical protein VMY18_11605, partial [Acidobacteriota bacterium]|nr:hypothetical protein [Acidobacteriota bacterium]